MEHSFKMVNLICKKLSKMIPLLQVHRFTVSPAHLLVLFSTFLALSPVAAEVQKTPANNFMSVIKTLSSYGDRSTGTPGFKASADYIKKRLTHLGVGKVGTHLFTVPVLRHEGSHLILPDQHIKISIDPADLNAISPQSLLPEGFEGPLIYVGTGELKNFNGKLIQGSIILMDLDSGKNWLHAANLGAKALIYVDPRITPKAVFEEKVELSPIHFPRFWMPITKVREIFD